jgi:transcriptional regulator with XRE-family HTH domain
MTDTAQHGGVPQFEMRHRMRLALEHARVSVNEMGDLLGVDRNTVSRYLNGHTTPRLSVLRVWSMRCGVPLTWITTGRSDGNDTGPGLGVSPSACYPDRAGRLVLLRPAMFPVAA